uniref:39S ribosomal protein L27, mitochondrial-like n=1 Tax=Ciona intestinalis TaxID=7719 RepID=UPI000180B066|nr:39S ribosomal protein L27, mitochondrial-like [Ciona intestinalis]|eukprot:XP_002126728.3 39S ribosomal protein L27, mitochondrial-like [Ciona intestinalis]
MVRKFRWLPGANVVAGRKMRLVAKCSGTVRFTKEVYIPGPESPDAEIAKNFVKGAVMYRTFINVVPERDVGRFKLVETV